MSRPKKKPPSYLRRRQRRRHLGSVEALELEASKRLRRQMMRRAVKLVREIPDPPGPGEVLLCRPVAGRPGEVGAETVRLTDELRAAALESMTRPAEHRQTAAMLDSTALLFVIIASDGEGRASVSAVARPFFGAVDASAPNLGRGEA